MRARDGQAGSGPAVALLAVLLLFASSAPVAAVEPIPGTPLPEEHPGTTLPHDVAAAVAVDLDGDQVSELLAVSASEGARGLAAIQAWWVADDGSVEPSNRVRVRRSASVDELLSGRGRLGIDRDDMIAVRMSEPAKFIVAQRAGRQVVLVATMGTFTDLDVDCCLTIWEVVVTNRTIDLQLVAATQRFAAELAALDMDADGTDELFVTEGPTGEGQTVDAAVLRWDGAAYARDSFSIEFGQTCCRFLVAAVGETDGIPGEEALLVGYDPHLLRVSLREGRPVVERGDIGDVEGALVLDLVQGPALVTYNSFVNLDLWTWARDGQPDLQASRRPEGTPVAVVGTRGTTQVLVAGGLPPSSIQVLDGEGLDGLAPAPTFGRDIRAGTFIATLFNPFFGDVAPAATPFYGLVPGGLPGAPEAFVLSGQVIYDSGPEAPAQSMPIALLPGLELIGRVGPTRAWTVVLSNFAEVPDDFGRDGVVSLLTTRGIGVARLLPTEAIMETEANGGHLEPTFFGVADDPNHSQTLLVGDEAVDAEVQAPPGSVIGWATRGGSGTEIVDADGVSRIRLLEPAGQDAPSGSGATPVMWVVTPAGHAYSGVWRIRVFREPPALTLGDEGALLDFSPTLSGQTVPGATLTINGQPADVADDGSFEAAVDVGILPTELRVAAVDPIGNRTERVVSLVWPVDYRRLPFVPLAVVLTVVAALVLFLRRPDAGPSRRTPDDGATFEEIGG